MSLSAVITGDIVNSTRLPPGDEKKLIGRLSDILKPFQFAFYRGDSFQVYMKEPERALEIALLCRTMALGFAKEKTKKITDVRMGIGIGRVTEPVRDPGSANGEAFLLSGRTFDDLEKSGSRLAITSTDEMANAGFSVLSDYINEICRKMSVKQANVIFELLQGYSQQETAIRLKKSKSTINQHVTAGSWNELEKLVLQYRRLIILLNK
ncbi:MAG: hypothetical protein ACHQD7_09455 [Chitinophagales bacterium]